MKKRTDNKLPFKEVLSLSVRGIRLCYTQTPGLFALETAQTVLSALSPYVTIYFSAKLIDALSYGRDPKTLGRLVVLTLVSEAAIGALAALLTRLKNYVDSDNFEKTERIFTQKLLSMDYCVLDRQKTHDLRSQISQNRKWGWGLARCKYYYNTLLGALSGLGGAIALSASLFTRRIPEECGTLVMLDHPAFLLALAGALISVTLIIPMISTKASSYWARYSENAKFGNRTFAEFGFYAAWNKNNDNRADMRIYDQDRLCNQLLHEYTDATLGHTSQIARWAKGPMGLLSALASAVSTLFTGGVYVFVCLKAYAGAFGIGDVTRYIGAITGMSGRISTIINSIGDMRNNAPFLRTVFEFLDLPDPMYQGSLTVEKRRDRNYEIEFKNVSFKYPDSDIWALKNVNIRFRVGQRLAVVGHNGSGKTTFIKLLCRMYDPTEGKILLNGIDIRKYDYKEYLSVFSVVFQDFNLFALPLGENVAASKEYDRARVEQVLRKAGFGERLDSMPRGLDTYLYKALCEDGVEISGGEAQKIALARALYKDAPFIILDEPTAALDPIAEYEIYTKFNELVGDKTAIYISHRLSSCRFCDDIAVFDGGTVIQKGSHKSLVSDKSGKYYELWHAQAQYYT